MENDNVGRFLGHSVETCVGPMPMRPSSHLWTLELKMAHGYFCLKNLSRQFQFLRFFVSEIKLQAAYVNTNM